VCHQWLDIVNSHRGIETSVVYDPKNPPDIQYLRRFKNISFFSTALPAADDVKVLCQNARAVKFSNCRFPSLDALKEYISTCGDLSRLELNSVRMGNWLMEANVENIKKSRNQKIKTLVLVFFSAKLPEWRIIEMFHNALINVANIELNISSSDYELKDLVPVFSVLGQHYQDQLRNLEVYEGYDGFDRPSLELLQGFSRLKLEKLTTFFNQDEHFVSRFISSQPTITELKFHTIYFEVFECALRNLPLLTVLKLHIEGPEEFELIGENTHRLRALTCLELTTSDTNPEGFDITFITQLPNLRIFSGTFFPAPNFIILGPVDNPMLQMKEFHIKCSRNFSHKHDVDIDPVSMWNIFHRMPNLEKMSLVEETAKVCNLALFVVRDIEIIHFFSPADLAH
jgi:hypothetical protein